MQLAREVPEPVAGYVLTAGNSGLLTPLQADHLLEERKIGILHGLEEGRDYQDAVCRRHMRSFRSSRPSPSRRCPSVTASFSLNRVLGLGVEQADREFAPTSGRHKKDATQHFVERADERAVTTAHEPGGVRVGQPLTAHTDSLLSVCRCR